MSVWTSYHAKPTLLDVQVTKIGSGQQWKSPNAGAYDPNAQTHIEITPNTINSTAVDNGQVWDACYLEIIPPIDADGTYPDCEITFEVDGKDYSDYLLIDGSYLGNMFPRRMNTVGRRYVKLGHSTRDLMYKVAKGNRVNGAATMITGLKASSRINVKVKSNTGWGQTGAATTPLRVILKGDVLTASDLAEISSAFSQAVLGGQSILQAPPTLPYYLNGFDINGVLSMKTWSALPGGPKQSGVKINRKMQYAYNAQATGTSGIYVFSQLQSVQGQEANVVDNHHDLGYDFSSNNDVVLINELGLRFAKAAEGVQAFWGYRIDGTIIPQDTPNGTPVSYNVNDYQYGQVGPQQTGGNMWFALPEASELAKIMLYQNAGAPFISTAGTTAIAAGDVSIAQGGVLIEQN